MQFDEDNYVKSLLNPFNRNKDLSDGNILEERCYERFVHDCHLKRYGFIKFYLKNIFNECNVDDIMFDLKDYDSVVEVFERIKNNKYRLFFIN